MMGAGKSSDHGVTEVDIDLELEARLAEMYLDLGTEACEIERAADRHDRHGVREELESVGLHGADAHVTKHLPQALGGLVDDAQKADIASVSMGIVLPRHEQHRALEDKLRAVWRLSEPVQEAFGSVLKQQDAVIAAASEEALPQPAVHGGGQVAGLTGRHATASRYGCMTRFMRQILPYSHSSSSVQARVRRQSRSASMATSTPILWRNLKQSTTVLAGL